jgi:hypothetical protein
MGDYSKWVLIRQRYVKKYKYFGYYYLLLFKKYWYKILFLKLVCLFKIS